MALSNTAVVEIETGGADTAGGMFNPGNASMATDLAATSGNTASPVVSSASYNFVAGDIGAWLFIQSGTNWIPGWYQIASVAANAATLSAAVAAAVLYGTKMNTSVRPYAPSTAAGCATTASPSGGVWSIDYSQQAAAQFVFSDMTIGAAGATFTSAGHPVGKNFVGNVINVTGGTNATAGRYEVVSTVTTTATLDRNWATGASSNGAGNLGGALLTFVQAAGASGFVLAGNDIFLKSGTYSQTAVTNLSVAGDSTSGYITLWGYHTLRGDSDGTRPVITSATTTVNLIDVNGRNYWRFHNLKITHTGATRGRAVDNLNGAGPASFTHISNCVIDGCVNAIIADNGLRWSSPFLTIDNTEIKNCTSDAIFLGDSNAVTLENCYIHSNTGAGLNVNVNHPCQITVSNTIFDSNSYGIDVQNANLSLMKINECVFYNQTNSGIRWQVIVGNTGRLGVENSIFVSNGAYGVELVNAWPSEITNRNNAYYNNTSGQRKNLPPGTSDVALTGVPFTNAAGGDFSLNNTASQGAACRAAGFPGVLTAGGTGYLDIGTLQHQDAGGGAAGMLYIPNLEGI